LGHYTPHYIFHPFSALLLARTFPDQKVRFLVVLREPVSRTVSSYQVLANVVLMCC
jgi:hypothetical protein